jgi:hypothetical protein
MIRLLLFTLGLVLIGVLYLVLPKMLYGYLRFCGSRLVRCPAAKDLAEIHLDARRAALTSAIGSPRIRVNDCSLWPTYAGCAQRCVRFFE